MSDAAIQNEETADTAVATGTTQPENPEDRNDDGTPVTSTDTDPASLDAKEETPAAYLEADRFQAREDSLSDIYGKRKSQVNKEIDIDDAELTDEQRLEKQRAHALLGDPNVSEEVRESLTGPAVGEEGHDDVAAAAAAPAAPESGNVDNNGETTTITVYGKKIDVTQEDIDNAGSIRELQIKLAGDEKLQRASTLQASLSEYHESLDEREATLAQQEANLKAGLDRNGNPLNQSSTRTDYPDLPNGGEGGTVEADAQELAAEMAESFFESDSVEEAQEKLTSAISKIMSGRGHTATPITEEAINTAVQEQVQRALSEQTATTDEDLVEQDRIAANQVFVDEFADLASNVNPHGFTMVQAEIEKVKNAPIMFGRPMTEVVRLAGERTKALLKGDVPSPLDFSTDPDQVPVEQVPNPNHIEGRLAHKERTVPSQPQTSNSQRHEVLTESVSADNSAYVASLRKSRGLAD